MADGNPNETSMNTLLSVVAASPEGSNNTSISGFDASVNFHPRQGSTILQQFEFEEMVGKTTATRSVGSLTRSAFLATSATQTIDESAETKMVSPDSAETPAESSSGDKQTQGQWAMRERELLSVIKHLEQSMEATIERKAERIREQTEKKLRDREVEVSQLHEATARKDKMIEQLQQEISTHEETLAEALREQRRQWKQNEGDLRSEVSRMLSAKERMRFDLEVAENKYEALVSNIGVTEQRASEAESRWYADALKRVGKEEDVGREVILSVQQEVFAALKEMADSGYAADQITEQRGRHCERRLRKRMTRAIRRETVFGDREEDDSSATDNSDAEEEGLRKSMAGHLEAVRTERESAAARSASLQEQIEALVVVAEDLNAHLTASECDLAAQVESLVNRVDSSDRSVVALQRKLALDGKRRAGARASGAVLEELVAEHDAQVAELTEENRKLREEVTEIRHVNKIDEAAELKQKVIKLTVENERAAGDLKKAQIGLEQLRSESRGGERLANEHLVALRSKNQELLDTQQTLQEERAAAASQRKTLECRVKDVEEAHEAAATKADTYADEAAELREEVAALRKANAKLWDDAVAVQVAETAKKLEAIAEADGPQLGAVSDPAGGAGPRSAAQVSAVRAADARELEELRDAMLLLRKDRDRLVRQLDMANAEVSASEERRAGMLDRHLRLLTATDSAPRREQGLQAMRHDLDREASRLDDRERALDGRSLELERKSAELTHALAQVQARLALGGDRRKSLASTSGSSANTPRENSQTRRQSIASRSSMDSSATGFMGNKLAPLAHRPVSVPTSSSTVHPQRAPPTTSFSGRTDRSAFGASNSVTKVSPRRDLDGNISPR